MSKKQVTEPVTIITDTREQTPLDFAQFAAYGIETERGKLHAGDYSVKGYEHHVFIERKSLKDLVGTLTNGRKRFLREIYDRGSFVPCKHLVIEGTWQQMSVPYPFAPGANPLAIVNSIYSLMMPPTGIHVFVGNRAMCAWYVANVAINFVRRVTHGSRGLWNAVNAPDSADLAPLPCPYRQIGNM